MRWSFGFGPFRIYGGRSRAARQAEARRNAREPAKREQARASRNSPQGRTYTRVVQYEHFSNANIYVRGDPSLLPENPLTTISLSIPGFEHVVPGNVVSFDLETRRPTAVHLVERGEDHAYRASVFGCSIHPHRPWPPGSAPAGAFRYGHAVHVAAQP